MLFQTLPDEPVRFQNLGDQELLSPVADLEVCHFDGLSRIDLAGHPGQNLFPPEAVTRHNATDAYFLPCRDEDVQVKGLPGAGFEEKGRLLTKTDLSEEMGEIRLRKGRGDWQESGNLAAWIDDAFRLDF